MALLSLLRNPVKAMLQCVEPTLAACGHDCETLHVGLPPATVLGKDTLVRSGPRQVAALDAKTAPTPDQALKQLMDGNKRYVANETAQPTSRAAQRAAVAEEQHPVAVVVGCADSRVSPEMLFDQGIGDVFVVRVAGNVVNNDVLGSVEYAVAHLHAPLVMVLGHENCGAVKAAVAGGTGEGHIESLLQAIRPAVAATRNQPGNSLDNAVRANVKLSAQAIAAPDTLLGRLAARGQIKVVGARYDLHSGKVELLA